jgi:hypothetical protein
MSLILKKSNKLFKEMNKFEKENGKVSENWNGIVTVAMDAIEDAKTFEDAVEPLMKWLSENQHPHTTVIVTGTTSELVEGLQTHLTDKFIVD